MQEVEALCERVIIINKGKIVADESLANLNTMSKGRESLIVSFTENLTAELLSSLPPILMYKKSRAAQNTLIIETDSPSEARKQIVQWCLEKELNIISLHNEKKDLEAIFQSLTLPIHSD
jgi:ABC-2 type transport system ATP-binding protein